MRVLLIYPTVRVYQVPPLGLMYIASALRKDGHEVELVDGSGPVLEHRVLEKLRWKPEIVGITGTTLVSKEVIDISRFIKRVCSNPPKIFVGGPHATVMPETFSENPDIDCVVRGEGEITFTKILRDGIEKKVYDGEVVENMDSLPFPAWDIVDKKYFARKRSQIMGSRGCPFNCAFCQPTQRMIFGSKVRRRSAGSVVAEMKELKEKYGIKMFDFIDDTFTANKNWCMDFANQVKFLKVRFTCSTRVDVVDEEILIALKGSGLYRATYGIESGSQKILDFYNKGVTVEENAEAIRLTKKAGIHARALFMIGSPNETMEDIIATKKFIKRTKPDTIFFAITTPMPQTALWSYCKERGLLITENFEDMDYFKSPSIKTEYITQEQVVKIRSQILRAFYVRRALNPIFVYHVLRERSLSHNMGIIKNIFKK